MIDKLKNWMIESANIMFDDSKSDLRSLPKTVRLQILIVLSFVWSTVFSLYVFSLTTFIWGWAGVVMAHIGLIIAVYITFKFFHKANKEKQSVFETGNYNPAKIFVVFFIIFFIFIFTKGVEVLTKTNSYNIPYSGPDTSVFERIKKFVK
tara:strand:+ start:48 stop:497 length:450 start_codon:yes stop_codon:yes gene_type:complete